MGDINITYGDSDDDEDGGVCLERVGGDDCVDFLSRMVAKQ
jgi:hypothetical protein